VNSSHCNISKMYRHSLFYHTLELSA